MLAEPAAWLELAHAHDARARCTNADQWADIAARFDALALPYPAAIARHHEADARLRGRSGHQRAAAAARTALATAEQLGLGRTNRQIADQLYISEKTASIHVTHLLRKLGVANRVEASAIAQRLEPSASS